MVVPKKPAAKKPAPKKGPSAKTLARRAATEVARAKHVKAGQGKEALKQRRILFANAYLTNGGNKQKAAVAAGYKPGPASGLQASRLWKNPLVQEIIAKGHQQAAEIAGLTTERTIREIARIAYGDVRKLFREDGSLKAIHELDDDTAAMVASVEVDERHVGKTIKSLLTKVKAWDKVGALEKAMKYHGLYKEDNSQKTHVVMQVSRLDEDI